jgi:hypothetical protein
MMAILSLRCGIYLFIYGLFNDAVSSSEYKASDDRINEQKRLWKETVVV